MKMKATALTGFLAFVEAIALLVASALLMRVLVDSFGVDRSAADRALFELKPPNWRQAAIVMGGLMIIRWGLLLAAAEGLSRARGYSIARPIPEGPAWPLIRSIPLALGVGAMLNLPSVLTRYYHFNVHPLGATPPIWPVMNHWPWTGDFWLFMAATSFVLVPLVEEAFFRGYFLGRLHRLFSPRIAIVLSGFFFAAMHGQYLRPDGFALFNSAMVFIGGVALAWLVVRTRSILPAVVEHAYVNVPHAFWWMPVDVAAAAIGLVVVAMSLKYPPSPGTSPS